LKEEAVDIWGTGEAKELFQDMEKFHNRDFQKNWDI
jgi:hypothetical protein